MSALKYQRGTIETIPTKAGPCYYLRYFERFPDGSRRRTRVRVGPVAEFRRRRDLELALQPIRARINEAVTVVEAPKTMADLIARYRTEEMPERHSTRRGYDRMLRNYIEPRWRDHPIAAVTAADARAWLRSLPIAPKTRGMIHGLMRVLFRFARLCRWFEGENPLQAFRMEGSNERTREPRILTRDEFHAFMQKLERPLYRQVVLIAATTGLSRSELAGLKWGDIDWMGRKINVRRGVVEGHEDDTKTKARKKPIPLDSMVADIFAAIRGASAYQDDTDWVLASPRQHGLMPYDMNEIQASHIRPAAEAAKVWAPGFGWHTFRHSYRTWLDDAEVPLSVQRDLMRHADIKTTANIYGAVHVDRLRKANQGVVKGILQ